MKKNTIGAIIATALLATGITLSVYKKDASSETTKVSAITDNKWSAESQEAIARMTKKYGAPDEKTATMMVWHNAGPWKKTIIHAKGSDHNFPKPHKDVIQQYIDYKVPMGILESLANFNGSVMFERTNGLLSSCCDKEEMNLMSLNIVNDIVDGKLTSSEARDFYIKCTRSFREGEKVEYAQKLQFQVQAGTADPDRAAEIENIMTRDTDK